MKSLLNGCDQFTLKNCKLNPRQFRRQKNPFFASVGAKAYVCRSCSMFVFKYSIRNIKLSLASRKGLNQPACINHECIWRKKTPMGNLCRSQSSCLRFDGKYLQTFAMQLFSSLMARSSFW